MTAARQCKGACQQVRPLADFRFRVDRMLYSTRCYACVSAVQADYHLRRKAANGGRRVSKPKMAEPWWPVPAHEYTEPDIAARAWRAIPDMGTAMPSLGMRCAL